MQPSSAVTLSLVLALSGCSYHYDLKAVELNGRIAFVPEKDKETGCLSYFKLTSEVGEVVWEVDGRYVPSPCVSKFPIIYGSVPGGMAERVKAEPLRAGVLYKVEGWDGGNYSGAFRFRQGVVIDNVKDAGSAASTLQP